MTQSAVLLVASAVFVWGLVSAGLERADLTAPVVFVALGGVLVATGIAEQATDAGAIRSLAEVTLVWVLFSDAARVRFRDLGPDTGRYLRLLGVGLPLSVAVGWALAYWMFPGLGVWLALLVGAALAPTDAALGLPVVTSPLVPARIRRLITVESGLNDGIVTPVVMLALAGAASAEDLAGAPTAWGAVAELALGGAVGLGAGLVGGWLLRRARARRWAAESFAGIAVLALALVAYTAAVALGANGFVAAFCGGIAFGAAAGSRGSAELVFLEQAGGLVSLLVWVAFGIAVVPIMVERLDLTTVAYAVLSLTVVRMAPVALCLLGAGLDRGSVLFVGWFGPRGLASLVFALLAVEDLGPQAREAASVIGATVCLSVLAHGFSAGPLAARYGRAMAARAAAPQTVPPG